MFVPVESFKDIVNILIRRKYLSRRDLRKLEKLLNETDGDLIYCLRKFNVPKEAINSVIREVCGTRVVDLSSISPEELIELNRDLPYGTIDSFSVIIVGRDPELGVLVCSPQHNNLMLRTFLDKKYESYQFVFCSKKELENAKKLLLKAKEREMEEELKLAAGISSDLQKTTSSSLDLIHESELASRNTPKREIELNIDLSQDDGLLNELELCSPDIRINLDLPEEDTNTGEKQDIKGDSSVIDSSPTQLFRDSLADIIRESLDIEEERDFIKHVPLSRHISRKFVVIGSPGENDPELIKAFIDAGCDAIKLHFNMIHPASGERVGSLKDELSKMVHVLHEAKERGISVGMVPFEHWREEYMQQLDDIAKGKGFYFDFVDIFIDECPPEVLTLPQEKVLAFRDSQVPVSKFWQNLPELKVVALELAIIPKSLYGHRLLLKEILERYSTIMSTLPPDIPLLFPTQLYITPSYLELLAAMGFRGIVIGTVVTSTEPRKAYRTVQEFVLAAERMKI